jgi:ferredoxin--NADP+ reductase
MGQKIKVTATALGDVAIFDLDRSLTGQDGVSFPTSPRGDTLVEILARHLWDADEGVTHVYVLSNTVSVRRRSNWGETTIETASDVISNLFIHYMVESPDDRDEKLREDNYNATITWIRAHNPELWVMRVRPDEPIEPFKPGQYTTLGLGYWEPRADQAAEDFVGDEGQRDKMARRSYSVSSSIIDEAGELVEPHPDDVEFYVVQVRPGEVEIPALTPRMFTKGVGDRIFMSRKFTGRYTLDGVQPTDNVVFLSTGTGEAPQNAMTAELLRNGHLGRIISVVCVRYRRDLAYTEQHAVIEDRYSDYRYVTLTTREPENEGNKVYIQNMITSGRLEEELGSPLDPSNTHVFLCGNPSMIGLPVRDVDAGTMEFPETLGVCQILHERGFTIDHRKERGDVHYEEYWKDR